MCGLPDDHGQMGFSQDSDLQAYFIGLKMRDRHPAAHKRFHDVQD
jgi:hypothetical protein